MIGGVPRCFGRPYALGDQGEDEIRVRVKIDVKRLDHMVGDLDNQTAHKLIGKIGC